jgi:hypothetical protein
MARMVQHAGRRINCLTVVQCSTFISDRPGMQAHGHGAISQQSGLNDKTSRQVRTIPDRDSPE